MSGRDVFEMIAERFSVEWGIKTVIEYWNLNLDEFDFTKQTNSTYTHKDHYVRLTVNFGNSRPATIGNNSFDRHNGIIAVQIFAPLAAGTLIAHQLADDVNAIFSKQSFGDVRCGSTNPPSRPLRENGWFLFSVTTPFKADN